MSSLELPTFRSAVWNLYGGTAVSRSIPALRETIEWGCSLWIVCEARGHDRTKMFRDHGLQTAVYDQYRLAWDPKRWGFIKEWHDKISNTAYFAKDGKTPKYSWAQFAHLLDKASGPSELVLEAGSYHTPAHIQRPADDRPMRRYVSFVESMLFLAAQANESKADGILYGGDDNWDEDQGVQTKHTEPVFLGKATGLKQIQAGKPTFGGREIDDYRILRLKRGGQVAATGRVAVIDGRGAEKPRHQIHMREWRWHGIEPSAVNHSCPRCGLVHSGVVLN